MLASQPPLSSLPPSLPPCRMEVCSLLLCHGADPTIPNCHSKTALDLATSDENRERIECERETQMGGGRGKGGGHEAGKMRETVDYTIYSAYTGIQILYHHLSLCPFDLLPSPAILFSRVQRLPVARCCRERRHCQDQEAAHLQPQTGLVPAPADSGLSLGGEGGGKIHVHVDGSGWEQMGLNLAVWFGYHFVLFSTLPSVALCCSFALPEEEVPGGIAHQERSRCQPTKQAVSHLSRQSLLLLLLPITTV